MPCKILIQILKYVVLASSETTESLDVNETLLDLASRPLKLRINAFTSHSREFLLFFIILAMCIYLQNDYNFEFLCNIPNIILKSVEKRKV